MAAAAFIPILSNLLGSMMSSGGGGYKGIEGGKGVQSLYGMGIPTVGQSGGVQQPNTGALSGLLGNILKSKSGVQTQTGTQPQSGSGTIMGGVGGTTTQTSQFGRTWSPSAGSY